MLCYLCISWIHRMKEKHSLHLAFTPVCQYLKMFFSRLEKCNRLKLSNFLQTLDIEEDRRHSTAQNTTCLSWSSFVFWPTESWPTGAGSTHTGRQSVIYADRATCTSTTSSNWNSSTRRLSSCGKRCTAMKRLYCRLRFIETREQYVRRTT